MKTRSVKNVILISLISVFLLIFNFIIKKSFFAYAESILAAFILLIVFLAIHFLGIQKDRSNRFKNNLFLKIAQILTMYFIFIYLLGLYFGFSKLAFSLKPLSILNNIFAPVITFVSLEIFRYIVTNSNRDNLKKVVFFNFLIGIIELSVTVRTLQFGTFVTLFKTIVDFILPIGIMQIALGFLCYYGGMKPLLLYRLVMVVYTYLIPIQPSFSDTMFSMLNIVLPLIIIIKIVDLVNEEKNEKVFITKRNNTADFIIGTILAGGLLLIISGVLPFGMTAIASDSMYPTFGKGSAVFTVKVKENSLKEGDIISFDYEDTQIVHRIESIETINNEKRYYTKGDANNSFDIGYITYDNINSKIVFSVPLIGYPAIFISELFN